MVVAMQAAPINAVVARQVTAARRAAGMSRVHLADATGIAERTLARRESGRSTWTTDELVAIAEALGIAVESLIAEAVTV
jgi:transcriptional regulator with XRE-family HTH domain